MALAAPLATASDRGPGQRPVAQPEPPAFSPPFAGINKRD